MGSLLHRTPGVVGGGGCLGRQRPPGQVWVGGVGWGDSWAGYAGRSAHSHSGH